MSEKTKYLAGNPIVITIAVASSYATIFAVYTGATFDTLIYTGSASSINSSSHIAQIDISELFAPMINQAGILEASIECGDDIQYITVYGGGISKLLMRKLNLAGTDIFSWKLKNVNRNFFLTTRTNNRLIVVPEDELLPLSFYTKGLKFSIKSSGETIASYDYSNASEESVSAIDIAALRRDAMFDRNKLLSVFDIITGTGGYSCTIVVQQVSEKHDYFLKFRNSLGAFEKISIDGLMEFSPEFSESISVAKFDDTVNDFVNSEQRKTFTNTYKAEIGYKSPEERLFVMDALLSDERYLVVADEEFAVKVSAENSVFQNTNAQPTAMSITLKMNDEESSFSPIDKNDSYMATSEDDIITTNDFKILV